MINFKNVLKVPYIGFNFLIIILILGLLTFVSETLLFISLIFAIFLSVGIIGTHILFGLKNYNSKTIFKILELSLIYFVTSIIFLILQFILFFIIILPISLITRVDSTNFSSINTEVFIISVIFIIVLFFILVLEFIKNIGFIKYLSTSNFEDLFKFKKYFKIVFSKDFLIGISFLIGFLIILILIFLLFVALLNVIFSQIIVDYLIGFLVIIFIYILISVIFVTFYEIVKNVKNF